ncbi:ATP-binding protein [Acinetobacter sp. ANC 4648]|uniref:ATP-binding protein n=1 Tax=Acinetobacter sp. ANC 4648 TaxID=1977875 RepID=UPI000A34ABAB|nr:ATP-binding protein [Acinetobacter sp. ANC 4648]OTG82375.1 DNA replication protein [Acinetobacter sp. ANC 4648]
MNAMAMISNGLQKVQGYCSQHNIQKVQAGPNQVCPECAKELVNQNNREHHKQVKKMVSELHFAGAMIPDRHTHSGFKNYTVNPNLSGQANALSKSVEFAKSMLNGLKCNLVMTGKTGTGKTHLSCATARTLLNKGMYARYITSEEMAQKIMNAWDKDTKGSSEQSVIYEFTQYDLLILDEYGLHDRDKRLELVHKVLYARYDAMKPTMLISNFTLKQLKDDLGDRLWSRFQQGGLTTIECNWVDQRLGGGV